MKKLLILLLAFALLGCETKEEDSTPVEPVDTTAPIIQIEKLPTLYTTSSFNLDDYIRVTDDSEYSVSWSGFDLEKTGDQNVTIEAVDIYGNVSTTRLTIRVQNGIHLEKQLSIVNLSDFIELNNNILTVYRNQTDPETSYVNLEEYIQETSGITVELETLNDETLTVRYITRYEKRYLRTEYDSLENTIFIKDLQYFDLLGPENPSLSEVGGDGMLVLVDFNREVTERLIDLDDYGIDIVKQEGQYYVPLYLVNLFLTDTLIETVELEEQFIITDYYNIKRNEEYFEITQDIESNNIQEVSEDTYNYLALWFDVFYGLKEHKAIENSYKLLDRYPNIRNPKDEIDFYDGLSEFIADLEDMHTRHISSGYRLPDYEASHPTREQLWEETENYYCNYEEEAISLNIVDDIAFVKINEFTNTDAYYYGYLMTKASEYETIVLDLSCNLGGTLGVAIDYLSYLSDEPFDFYGLNTITKDTYHYKGLTKEEKFIDRDYYIFTSPVTFSAGNLFAQIVKENNLATIIGTKTAGGACSSTLIATPDGALFQYSSRNGFTDSKYDLIEDGVEPDFYLSEQIEGKSWEETVVEFIKTLEKE